MLSARSPAWKLAEGELSKAAMLASRALDVGSGADPASADAHLALAGVARERNHLDVAARALDEAEHLLRSDRRFATLSICTVEAALLALAEGRWQDGIELVDTVSHRGSPATAPGAGCPPCGGRGPASSCRRRSRAGAVRAGPLLWSPSPRSGNRRGRSGGRRAGRASRSKGSRWHLGRPLPQDDGGARHVVRGRQ